MTRDLTPASRIVLASVAFGARTQIEVSEVTGVRDRLLGQAIAELVAAHFLTVTEGRFERIYL